MLPVLPNIFFSVAVAVTATLSASSARNMWCTYTACLPTTSSDPKNNCDGWQSPPSSAAEIICQLRQCSRKQSLKLFLHAARVPMGKEVDGVWDGVLLENNGVLMVLSSHTIMLLYNFEMDSNHHEALIVYYFFFSYFLKDKGISSVDSCSLQ